MKENEKYLDLIRNLIKLKNMKVTVKPTVVETFGTVTNDMEKKTGGISDQSKNQYHIDHSIVNILRTLLVNREDSLSFRI